MPYDVNFQSTDPRMTGASAEASSPSRLELVDQLLPGGAIFRTSFPRSSTGEVGENHGYCLHYSSSFLSFLCGVSGHAFREDLTLRPAW